jgi:hypothetical protein
MHFVSITTHSTHSTAQRGLDSPETAGLSCTHTFVTINTREQASLGASSVYRHWTRGADAITARTLKVPSDYHFTNTASWKPRCTAFNRTRLPPRDARIDLAEIRCCTGYLWAGFTSGSHSRSQGVCYRGEVCCGRRGLTLQRSRWKAVEAARKLDGKLPRKQVSLEVF